MPILALLFVLSGAAGLIYESVWARYIGLLVGHSAYAQVIVLVIFLGGMAIGSLAIGKFSERIRAPLLWYAITETIIGAFAFAFHPTFVAVTNAAYTSWLPHISPGPGLTAATWSLAALLILPQSILLGATFPLMTAGAIRRFPDRVGRSLGLLYFANSFGAAIGALVEGFVLIGAVGLDGTLRVAGWLNFIVAAGIVVCFVRPSRPARLPLPAAATTAPATTEPPRLRTVLLWVSFATAFSSFLYEIAWTRMLSLVHGSATHSFELMLSAFVLGLALGAFWIGRRADDTSDTLGLLARMQWAMGLAAVATLPLYVLSFDWTASLMGAITDNDAGYNLYSVMRYAITLMIMLPATFCAGTTLPLITKALLSSGWGERSIGAVYGVNTIGSIIGAGVAALVLVPLIGLKWVLISGGAIDIGVGIGLWLWHRPSDAPLMRRYGLLGTLGATAAVLIAVVVLSPFSPRRLASGVYRYAKVTPENTLRYFFYEDGRTASVSVRQDISDTLSLITISTNGKPDASVLPALMRPYDSTADKILLDQDMSTQVFLPLLTMAHAPRARVGAVIGEGSGTTSHMLLGSPVLQHLHTIEIEPAMIRGSHLFYPGNRRVFDDPRSTFEHEDARAFLASTGPKFDFILSEPSNPWVSGVSSLFTVEFYRRAIGRLNPDGVFVQWFHLYEIDDATVATVLASIDRVFPSYRVYFCSNSDIVIVAGASPTLAAPDWSVEQWPGVAEDLRRFPTLQPALFEASELGERTSLHGFLTQWPVNSDYRPILDLDGERLRYRHDYATGFRQLGEARMDVPAALEGRRRDFGAELLSPVPEIFRPTALAEAATLKAARLAGSLTDTAGSPIFKSAYRLQTLDRGMSTAMVPVDWSQWLSDFAAVEADMHGGTAGVADEHFYAAVRRFLTAASAPFGVQAGVDFYHGLASWNFAETARAGDVLESETRLARTWISPETLRQGLALARIKLGQLEEARGVYNRLPPGDRIATLTDRILIGVLENPSVLRRTP